MIDVELLTNIAEAEEDIKKKRVITRKKVRELLSAKISKMSDERKTPIRSNRKGK